MSKKRQSAIFDPQGKRGAQVTTLPYEYESGHEVPEHFHREDQLVFASAGVMKIRTEDGVWMVPPQKAVWIPGEVVHSISMSGKVSMRTLYFAPNFVKSLPRKCFVMNVSPLLRELILHTCHFSRLKTKVPKEKRLLEIILDHLDERNRVPLQLPIPNDPRAKRIADALISEPGNERRLEELCKDCGASKRTIERLFLEETQMTIGKWRQQLRMLHAIELLASGEKVINVALDSGYNSPSAFILAFRNVLGTTPSTYLGGS